MEDFIEEDLTFFKKSWEEENPENWEDALRNCDNIWKAENNLRKMTDYPEISQEHKTVEAWFNDESGAYVYGDAWVRKPFIKYIFEKKLDINDMSTDEIADAYYEWAQNNCFLKLRGDTWSDKEKREIKIVYWVDYIDGWEPDWITENSYDDDEDY